MSGARAPLADRWSPVSPVYGTTERDDVELARRWREQPERWRERTTVAAFEEAFAAWNRSHRAVAFESGRVALSAAFEALKLEPGAEVVVPGYTCVVVPNAIRFAGLIPVFADIELETYGLDAQALERAITPRTRAVVLQHLYGLVSRDYERALSHARRLGLVVIEDCAQAMGAQWKGANVGTRGDIGIYSTERSKVISSAQGGIAVTNQPDLASQLAHLAERAGPPDAAHVRRLLDVVPLLYRQGHSRGIVRGNPWARQHRAGRIYPTTTAAEARGERPGDYGRAMSAPAAALALNQLGKIERFTHRRRAAATVWDEWCHRTGHALPLIVQDSAPVFLRYPVLVDPERKRRRDWAVRELGVDLGVWFTGKLHPVDPELPSVRNADRAVARCVNFPTLLPEDERWLAEAS
ncbi:MAG TPA: aminotransferase class I/II-fold pyridoxal phosphate-dependent enzyme [Longimicrobiales bacterium]|nr:aminotransferase class I/II-fold pyridoxal phosphate-dependent enzyme [Longimicrobiales bacterium]